MVTGADAHVGLVEHLRDVVRVHVAEHERDHARALARLADEAQAEVEPEDLYRGEDDDAREQVDLQRPQRAHIVPVGVPAVEDTTAVNVTPVENTAGLALELTVVVVAAGVFLWSGGSGGADERQRAPR